MSQLVSLNFNNAYFFALPGLNGIGDKGFVRTGSGEGEYGSIPIGSGGRESISTITADSRTIPCLHIQDSNTYIGPFTPRADFWFNNGIALGSDLSTWSMRAIVGIPASNWNNVTIIQALGGSTPTNRFRIDRFGVGGGYNGRWGAPGYPSKVGSPSGVMRLEIQHDSSQTPSTIIRLYQNNGVTPGWNSPYTLSAIGGANQVRFGDIANDNGAYSAWDITEVEIWDTRDGDGTFTNDWSVAQGTSYAGAKRTTTYSIPAQFTTPTDVVTANYTSYMSLGYGNFDRWLNLFIPNGTPPNGSKWPVIVLGHGGFFVGGNPSEIPDSLRNRLLNAGYAVAIPRYLVSVATNNAISPYGTANADSGNVTSYGRYPSHIVDFKLAVVRLRDRYSATGTDPKLNDLGFGIDGTKVFAGGGSAGTYLAYGAALTNGLTSDGNGVNLTIAGNPTFRIMEDGTTPYTGADPDFIGCFGLATVNNLQTYKDTDLTHNNSNAVLWPAYYPTAAPNTQGSEGVSFTVTKAFFGMIANGPSPSAATVNASALSNFATLNSSSPKIKIPFLNIHSESDSLLQPIHHTQLTAALQNTVKSFDEHLSVHDHFSCGTVYDWPALEAWLNQVLLESQPSWLPSMQIV